MARPRPADHSAAREGDFLRNPSRTMGVGTKRTVPWLEEVVSVDVSGNRSRVQPVQRRRTNHVTARCWRRCAATTPFVPATPAIDFSMKADNMIRQLSILTLVIVLVGGMQPGHAQPRS